MQTRFLASLRDTAACPWRRPSTWGWLATQPPVAGGGQGPREPKLLLYRAAAVWDCHTRPRRTVKAADVTVSDRLGTRLVEVGAQVVTLRIR